MEDDLSRLLSPPPQSDFNPRPPHGGRHGDPTSVYLDGEISIHVLRMEDDIH